MVVKKVDYSAESMADCWAEHWERSSVVELVEQKVEKSDLILADRWAALRAGKKVGKWVLKSVDWWVVWKVEKKVEKSVSKLVDWTVDEKVEKSVDWRDAQIPSIRSPLTHTLHKSFPN
jgi:hypothetical protein